MTEEEINAYVKLIIDTPLEGLDNVLPKADVYNFELKLQRISDKLNEEMETMVSLNKGNEFKDEIEVLASKISYCLEYLSKTLEKEEEKEVSHRLVFLKTQRGDSLFERDLKDISSEYYADIKNVFEDIINGVNESNPSKYKKLTNNVKLRNVAEYKGFKIRIFTTQLKGNVLCVLGIQIKKKNDDKFISGNLAKRVKDYKKEIEEMDADDENLLKEGSETLNKIMNILSNEKENKIEVLFSEEDDVESDRIEETAQEVKQEIFESTLNVADIEKPKKVKERKGRGLGKKTIVKNRMNDLFKDCSLEELLILEEVLIKSKKQIIKTRQDKAIEESIGNMYQGFRKMDREQINDLNIRIREDLPKGKIK